MAVVLDTISNFGISKPGITVKLSASAGENETWVVDGEIDGDKLRFVIEGKAGCWMLTKSSFEMFKQWKFNRKG